MKLKNYYKTGLFFFGLIFFVILVCSPINIGSRSEQFMSNKNLFETKLSIAYAQNDLTLRQMIEPAHYNDANNVIVRPWRFLRTLINSILVLIILLAAFANILHLNIDTYTVKKVLPALILGVILANLSLFICRMFIDVTNIISSTIANTSVTGGDLGNSLLQPILVATGLKSSNGAVTVSGGLMATIGVAAITENPFIYLFAFLILVGVPILFILCLALIFYARVAVLRFLIILSPIAFFAMAFPFTNQWFKRWWSAWINWLFMLPIVLFLMYLAELVSNATTGGGGGAGFISWISALVLMYAAIMTPFKLSGTFGQMVQGYQKLATKAGFGTMGTQIKRANLRAVGRAIDTQMGLNPKRPKGLIYSPMLHGFRYQQSLLAMARRHQEMGKSIEEREEMMRAVQALHKHKIARWAKSHGMSYNAKDLLTDDENKFNEKKEVLYARTGGDYSVNYNQNKMNKSALHRALAKAIKDGTVNENNEELKREKFNINNAVHKRVLMEVIRSEQGLLMNVKKGGSEGQRNIKQAAQHALEDEGLRYIYFQGMTPEQLKEIADARSLNTTQMRAITDYMDISARGDANVDDRPWEADMQKDWDPGDDEKLKNLKRREEAVANRRAENLTRWSGLSSISSRGASRASSGTSGDESFASSGGFDPDVNPEEASAAIQDRLQETLRGQPIRVKTDVDVTLGNIKITNPNQFIARGELDKVSGSLGNQIRSSMDAQATILQPAFQSFSQKFLTTAKNVFGTIGTKMQRIGKSQLGGKALTQEVMTETTEKLDTAKEIDAMIPKDTDTGIEDADEHD